MFLQHLSVVNYKNIAEAELDFCAGLNCFVGHNGAGKTNLCDAVYYLAFCKSRLSSQENQNLRHGQPYMMLQGQFMRGADHETIAVGYKSGSRKSFKRGGKEYTKFSDHIGLIPLVSIAPEDQDLVSEGSAARRKFVDGVIAQSDRQYLERLIEYEYYLAQRGALLRNEVSDALMYALCEEKMSVAADFIYQKRKQFIAEFEPVFLQYFCRLAPESEIPQLAYKSHLNDGPLLEQLERLRNRDLALGFTSHGIHKDDLEMQLSGYPIKQVGSQGQTKTWLIALKLAQFHFLKMKSGLTPLLLLDDVFDKLDASRVEAIVRLVSGGEFGQIFMTDTNREHLDELVGRLQVESRIYEVEEGRVL
ncbi:MAG: DNA replication and repair protein RecF [Paludibacteraceae bacterium]|nr:DNA replication and repair protein RecF [Paludibacteraceae bacterium]